MRPKTYDEWVYIVHEILDEIGASNMCRKNIAKRLMDANYSERCVCELVDISTCALNYKKVEQMDEFISDKIREVKARFPHYGYRRIRAELQREGLHVNLKKIYKLYTRICLEDASSREASIMRFPLRQDSTFNEVWAMDYLEFVTGSNKVQIVSVIDESSRQLKFCHAFSNISAEEIIIHLLPVINNEQPQCFVTDNGEVFNKPIWDPFYKNHNIIHNVISKGHPQENGFIERYNRTLREELLKYVVVSDLEIINRILDQWVYFYNNRRIHSSLGYMTPNEYVVDDRNFSMANQVSEDEEIIMAKAV